MKREWNNMNSTIFVAWNRKEKIQKIYFSIGSGLDQRVIVRIRQKVGMEIKM